MNITETRIRIIKKDTSAKFKALASITIDDCFVIHEIKIVQGDSGRLFITMPAKKTPFGEYKDIVHPINNATRDLIQNTILTAYQAQLDKDSKTEQSVE